MASNLFFILISLFLPMVVISLLTDYGITDSYVAEVKGVIYGINPDVKIVDISHDVGNYDIASGAFHLARSAPYFPKGTVHVGVVDPGVGGSRKGIIIKAKDAYFVGPDNGLMAPAAERLGFEKVYEIIGHEEFPKKVSHVFDGRDVFGPTGALLSKGVPPVDIGREISDYIRLPSYEPRIEGNRITASIIHVDNFGNIVTNVTYETLAKMGITDDTKFTVTVGDKTHNLPYVKRFSQVPLGELLTLVAGGGYLEISVNQGNAMKKLNTGKSGKVILTLN